MKILAVETSCDDTGVAVLEVFKTGGFKVFANIVSSQVEIHKKYGGVYPALAKREHQKNLGPVLAEALRKTGSNYDKPGLDLIAVTNGPGLEPCLWVGVNFAKELSRLWKLPVTEVNHIKAHMFVNNFGVNGRIKEFTKKDFPILYLIVSGGHTQLILMTGAGKYKILGETRDDAAGECFDKCAKILGLGYPGGPIISQLAQGIKPKNILPRPMANSKDYDFSFSGLKTAVLYADKKVENKTLKYKKQMAAEVQQAIIDVLIKKAIKAARDYKVKKIILGGGVSANQELRKQFSEKVKGEFELAIPPANLSTDNALMVAVAGYFRAKQNKFTKWQDLEAKANLRVE